MQIYVRVCVCVCPGTGAADGGFVAVYFNSLVYKSSYVNQFVPTKIARFISLQPKNNGTEFIPYSKRAILFG